MKKIALAMMVMLAIAGTSLADYTPVKVLTDTQVITGMDGTDYTIYTYNVGITVDDAAGITTVTDMELTGLQGVSTGYKDSTTGAYLPTATGEYANMILGEMTNLFGAVTFEDHTGLDTHILSKADLGYYCGKVYPILTAGDAAAHSTLGYPAPPAGTNPAFNAFKPAGETWDNLLVEHPEWAGDDPTDHIEYIEGQFKSGYAAVDNSTVGEAGKIDGTAITMGAYDDLSLASNLILLIDSGQSTGRYFGVAKTTPTANDCVYALQNAHGSAAATAEGDNDVLNTLMFAQVVAIEDAAGNVITPGYVSGAYQNADLAGSSLKTTFEFQVHETSAVPEPGTVVMLVLGALCLVGARLRRK